MSISRGYSSILSVALGAALCLLALSDTAFGQSKRAGQPERGSSESAGSVLIGTVAGEPGTNVTVPVYYKPSKGAALRTLHLELEFVSNSVKFAKAEKAPVSEKDDFDLAANSKEAPSNDEKIHRTQIALDFTVSGGDKNRVLPEGLWAFLDFQIPPDAKPFSISLNARSVEGTDHSGKGIQLSVEAGQIIVSSADLPLAGCFFFSH